MKGSIPLVAAAALTIAACSDHGSPVGPAAVANQRATQITSGNASVSGTVVFVADSSAGFTGTAAAPAPNVAVNYYVRQTMTIPIDTGGSYVSYTYNAVGSVTTGAAGDFTVGKLGPGTYTFRAAPSASTGYLGSEAYVTVSSQNPSQSQTIRLYLFRH